MKSPRPPQRPLLRDASPPPATRAARGAAPVFARFSAGIVEDLARKTRYVAPDLIARWADLAGPELSRLCRPGRLTGGRMGGRADGRTLEVIVPHGAAAASVEFAAETLKRRLNGYFGPDAIARIVVIQAAASQTGSRGPDSGGKPGGGGLSRFRSG